MVVAHLLLVPLVCLWLVLALQVEDLIMLLWAKRCADTAYGLRPHPSPRIFHVIRGVAVELQWIKPSIVALLISETLRNLLEKAILMLGLVCIVARSHSIFEVEERLLLLLHLVGRVCLCRLPTINRARDVVTFICAGRCLLQLLHRGVGLVITHRQIAKHIVLCSLSRISCATLLS